MIPTTVYAAPFSRRVEPSTAGTPPKRRRQSPWPSTTTCSRPGCSSSGRNVRPLQADTPSVSKKSAETSRPRTRSGSPAPVRLASQGRGGRHAHEHARLAPMVEEGRGRARGHHVRVAVLEEDHAVRIAVRELL